MGLFDEAIREHLELKRRRGADPSAVAREEREALEPVAGELAGSGEQASPGDEVASIGEAVWPVEPAPQPDQPRHAGGHMEEAPTDAHSFEAGNGASGGESQMEYSSVGQETAELDMEAVISGDARVFDEGAVGTVRADIADGVVDPPAEADRDGEPGHASGQERLSF
jgi:hypothetical protein